MTPFRIWLLVLPMLLAFALIGAATGAAPLGQLTKADGLLWLLLGGCCWVLLK